MVDRTQSGSTHDQAGEAQHLDQIADVVCWSQGHKNTADAFYEQIIMAQGKGSVGVENGFNIDGLLKGSRRFEWSHGWRKAVEPAHVHVRVRRKQLLQTVTIRSRFIRRNARLHGFHDADRASGLLQGHAQGGRHHGFSYIRIRPRNEDAWWHLG